MNMNFMNDQNKYKYDEYDATQMKTGLETTDKYENMKIKNHKTKKIQKHKYF